MNRKLKFRVWSFLSKSFEYFDIYQGANLGIAGGVSEPQQFTGLIDKNEKDVYEGDFITFSCNYTIDSSDVDVVQWGNQEVFYDEEYAGFYFGRKREFQILDINMPETIEVVGNIFENNNLSTKEK
jgi:uncharacterized phage protein (TIGR01671 family)